MYNVADITACSDSLIPEVTWLLGAGVYDYSVTLCPVGGQTRLNLHPQQTHILFRHCYFVCNGVPQRLMRIYHINQIKYTNK